MRTEEAQRFGQLDVKIERILERQDGLRLQSEKTDVRVDRIIKHLGGDSEYSVNSHPTLLPDGRWCFQVIGNLTGQIVVSVWVDGYPTTELIQTQQELAGDIAKFLTDRKAQS